MNERKGIVVYFRNSKAISRISKMDINIVYVNKPGKYLTGYVDEKDFLSIKKQLKKNKLIRNVEESLVEMPQLDE
jgi:uncharacterized protein YlbG (UPF0298 family)